MTTMQVEWRRLMRSLISHLTQHRLSRREVVFAVTALGLVFLAVSDHLVRSVYWPRRQELSARIERHEKLLRQNKLLVREAEAIRQRYETSTSRASTEPAGDMGDIVRAVGNAAEGLVQLVSVSPTGAGDQGSMERALVLQFEGALGQCGEFLSAVAQDLGGECTALAVSVAQQAGQGVKCTATWVFPLAVDTAPRVSMRDSSSAANDEVSR